MLLWLLACPALAQSRSSSQRRPVPPASEGHDFAWVPYVVVVGGGMSLFFAGLALMHRRRLRPRVCARCHHLRTRLDELAEDDHLNPGQRLEEKLGSGDYDVWWCEHCQDVEVLRYRPLFSLYYRCARCRYDTVTRSSTPLPRGLFGRNYVQVTLTCQNCHHVVSFKAIKTGVS